MEIWEVQFLQGAMSSFPCLVEFLVSLGNKSDEIKANNYQLHSLRGKYVHYFCAEEAKKFEWTRNPFANDVTTFSYMCRKREQLIEV
jgi:hypothetical protein